jgi:hypothetical protein
MIGAFVKILSKINEKNFDNRIPLRCLCHPANSRYFSRRMHLPMGTESYAFIHLQQGKYFLYFCNDVNGEVSPSICDAAFVQCNLPYQWQN